MAGKICIEKRAGVGFLVFEHPARRNAISLDMWLEIPRAATALARDDSVRVIVLRGAGDVAFISGADISEFERYRFGEPAAEYDAATGAALGALFALDKPVIAMIHGFCVGGGVALALTADLRYASEDARFAIPAGRLGLGYSADGLATLIDTVGSAAAKEILFTAKQFSAREALTRRLVDEVRPKAELEPFVLELAAGIAENAPLTLRSAKIIARELAKAPEARDRAAMDASIAACHTSRDYVEGVKAFLEKRRPAFVGS